MWHGPRPIPCVICFRVKALIAVAFVRNSRDVCLCADAFRTSEEAKAITVAGFAPHGACAVK